MKPRTMVAAGAALAITGSAAVALLLSGATSVSAAPAATATETVAAEVVSAPKPVTLAAPVTKPVAVRPATHAKPVVIKAASVTRTVRVATKAAPKPVAAAPKPAPKPAATKTATAPTSTATGDDYPWRTATTNDSDTWGFTKRQCVSFAAFRLAQHGHAINNADNWGSALTWDDAARRLGKTVTATPRVGAIAQWNAGESSTVYSSSGAKGSFTAGSYGHVGYVAAVYGDGSVLVEQYNLGGSRSYSAMRMKAPRYLLV